MFLCSFLRSVLRLFVFKSDKFNDSIKSLLKEIKIINLLKMTYKKCYIDLLKMSKIYFRKKKLIKANGNCIYTAIFTV